MANAISMIHACAIGQGCNAPGDPAADAEWARTVAAVEAQLLALNPPRPEETNACQCPTHS